SYLARNHLARVQGMRCHAPGGWSPRIRLEGHEHLDHALAEGKGAILWVAPMASRDLITKMALHRAGYAVSHLSRFDHGYSISLWGARLFNSIWTNVEERYVAERLVITPDTQVTPLRAFVKRLRGNRIVSITATTEGRRYPHVSRFFAGEIKLAEGAPSLAATTGAALLPVFSVREQDGGYLTIIEPPLRPTSTGDAPEQIAALTDQFVHLIESYVLRFPCDYQGWSLSGV
ncbi:MAG: hypothetical protein JSW09_04970, partial [Pseudomonadota bacterium]